MSVIDTIIINGVTYGIGGGEGLSNDLKGALDQMAQNVAYDDNNGATYYNALHSALYPPANLSYITCVYTQSGAVYDTDTLNSLKTDLVVTAHYTNGTTATVTAYTLSGNLVAGTSTITVSYGGKTTTFNVTVTHATRDTTADIAYSDKVLVHNNSEPYYDKETAIGAGITVRYAMDNPTTKLHLVGIIPVDDNNTLRSDQWNKVGNIECYDENEQQTTYVNVQQGNSLTRWAQAVSGTMTEYSQSWDLSNSFSYIAFSVATDYLDDAYMYDGTTGQVWFAGINTPYYGMTNISQANS